MGLQRGSTEWVSGMGRRCGSGEWVGDIELRGGLAAVILLAEVRVERER